MLQKTSTNCRETLQFHFTKTNINYLNINNLHINYYSGTLILQCFSSVLKLYNLKKLIIMKKLFVVALVAAAGFISTQSQASEIKLTKITAVQDSVIKTPIKLEELPDAIKTTLQSDPYKDWMPTAAFAVKKGDKQYYQVDVKKEEETKSLNFTADGKPIE